VNSLSAGRTKRFAFRFLFRTANDFVMRWAAGHRLESQRKFRQPIDEMFARFSYRSGDVELSDDVQTDERWKPLAKATRPYRSLVTVPIHRGDETVAVLNAISTYPAAFGDGDIMFLQLLAAIIEVAWAPGVFKNGDEQRRPSGLVPRRLGG
jgi:GAF domain-containing protein